MHVFMVKGGYSLDPNSEYYSQSAVVNKTRSKYILFILVYLGLILKFSQFQIH